MTTTQVVRGSLTIEVCEELALPRSTFYGWQASHQAPRCIKLPNGQISSDPDPRVARGSGRCS